MGRERSTRSSLVAQWLGLGFTARAWVQPLVKELRFHKPHGMTKRERERDINQGLFFKFRITASLSLACLLSEWAG